MSDNNSFKNKPNYKETHKSYESSLAYECSLYAEDSYDSHIWKIEKAILAQEIKRIKKHNIRYLDFACGTGRILSFVEQLVSESIGIDVSEEMISFAKKKINKSALMVCDLTSKDILPNRSYDLITAFRFFLNAENDLRKEVFKLLSKKLADEGIFIFNIHGNTYSYYGIPAILGRLYKKNILLNHMSYYHAAKMARKNGFKIVRSYGVGIIPVLFYKSFPCLNVFFDKINIFFLRMPIFKYISRNLIFVCKK